MFKMPNYLDTSTALVNAVDLEKGNVHVAWKIGRNILTFEHIPEDYPCTRCIVHKSKKEYLESIKDVPWIINSILEKEQQNVDDDIEFASQIDFSMFPDLKDKEGRRGHISIIWQGSELEGEYMFEPANNEERDFLNALIHNEDEWKRRHEIMDRASRNQRAINEFKLKYKREELAC